MLYKIITSLIKLIFEFHAHRYAPCKHLLLENLETKKSYILQMNDKR